MAASTRERILDAGLALFARQGYKATTTRAMSEGAGISEMTLFRHFGTKEAVLEAIIEERLTLPDDLIAGWRRTLSYELEPDLLAFARRMHQMLGEQRGFVELVVREAQENERLRNRFAPAPQGLTKPLCEYLNEMKRRKKMIESDAYKPAIAFVTTQLGYILGTSRFGERLFGLDRDAFIAESAAIFARGLRPE